MKRAVRDVHCGREVERSRHVRCHARGFGGSRRALSPHENVNRLGDDEDGAALKNWSKVNPAIFGTCSWLSPRARQASASTAPNARANGLALMGYAPQPCRGVLRMGTAVYSARSVRRDEN